MKVCSKCGRAYNAETSFCVADGTPVQEHVVPVVAVAPQVAQLPAAVRAAPVTPLAAQPVASTLRPSGQSLAAAPYSTLAVVGFILSMLTFGIIAIFIGHAARRQIRRSPYPLKGAGLTVATLVLGYIELPFNLLWIIGIIVGIVEAGQVH